MGRIKIEYKKCKGCNLCIINCPKGSITLDRNFNIHGVTTVRFKGPECNACTLCAQVCPECCIEVFKQA